jgi:hypothetical protein
LERKAGKRFSEPGNHEAMKLNQELRKKGKEIVAQETKTL